MNAHTQMFTYARVRTNKCIPATLDTVASHSDYHLLVASVARAITSRVWANVVAVEMSALEWPMYGG